MSFSIYFFIKFFTYHKKRGDIAHVITCPHKRCEKYEKKKKRKKNSCLLKFLFELMLGLSNPPAHPPNLPVPDWRSPDPTAPTVGRGSRVPKPDAGGSVSSSLVQNP